MLEKKILNVSFKDKDKVKQLGAKWDPQQKVWYIPPGKQTSAFDSWLIKPSQKPDIVISSIGIIRNIIPCWSCKGFCTVCAIYARNLKEAVVTGEETSYIEKNGFFILTEIATVPDSLVDFLSLRCNNYKLGKVSDSGEKFYRNHCDHCFIGFSDTRLHKKGVCFNPKSANQCKSMQFIDLLFFDDLKIKADYLDYTEHNLLLSSVTQADYLNDYI